ncbi:acid phosphatase/Vanadium-dependent haloperoxidase [Fomitiporia mediterranea MF3/22]|uniref:acid phosphatase/Vanadium-dependent haloperoxidase n=1 Tax=Fomitiporia mediterranea (strain MF3/22) TaxID=694068 RepID=UPI000440813C|nr:acid phosphatase/Vanadium-dependent haloperoxidase [Fomitiporia mediterranea MF3/22]EJD02077.1 acid phosphatase/Vanadium-dependent haloperoxidase [Fomitiporia mediterranea MF3/22]
MPSRRRHEGEKASSSEADQPRSRFSFGLWLRLHGADLITMALMGAVGLGIYEAPPAPNRSFPVYNLDGGLAYPEFAYPLRKEVVPIWLAAFIAFMAPFVFFVLFQIRRRSIEDLLTTTMGLLKSLITAAVFQVWLKWLIGGLRPHFYAVCQPNVPSGASQRGNGFQNIMYDRSVCTGDKDVIDDSLESFPSGHSTAGFAGLIYLALYFNAQLKVMSAHNPAYWKMIIFFAPILGATLIAGALTIDEFHNWYDVLAGAVIGTATAFVAFRQTFASVWDFRFNHIPLPRTSSLFLWHGLQSAHGSPPLSGFAANGPFFTYRWQPAGAVLPSWSLPVAREGGWGSLEEEHVGAPFDATAMSLGGVGGGAAGGYGPGTGGGALGRAEAQTGGRRYRP